MLSLQKISATVTLLFNEFKDQFIKLINSNLEKYQFIKLINSNLEKYEVDFF